MTAVLKLAKPEPNEDIIRILAELLEKAKRGEVYSLTVAAEVQDQIVGTHTVVGKGRSAVLMLGAADLLKHDLRSEM